MRRPVARGWAAVVLVAAGAIVAQAFGRFSYGVLLPAIRNDLDHSNTVAGLLGTVNVTAYFIGTLVVATVSARVRLLPIFRIGFVFSLSGLALAVVSPTAGVLAVALFLMGVGGAFIWIPSPGIATAQVGDERRGIAVGSIGAGIGLGILFTGQLSRVLRDRSGDEAWRDVYLVETILGAVVVVAVLLLLRHDQDSVAGDGAGGFGGFNVLRQMPGWGALTAAYAAYGFSYLLVLSFLTSRLEDDAGYSEGLAATMFGLVGVGTVLGGVTLGWLADRFGERTTMTVGFTLFSAAVVGIATGAIVLVAAGAVMLGLMFAGLAAVVASYVVRHTTPERFGPSYAAATLAFGVSQMLAPQVGGLLADATGSFTLVFALSATFALGGAVASSRLPA
ncbi:MAG: MFS transporter [Ilumatobacteraceae bacterium]